MSISANDCLLFSADKMRINAREAQKSLQEKEIQRVLNAISFEASQGNFEYKDYWILYESTLKTLKALGYKIKESKEEDTSSWIISIIWGTEEDKKSFNENTRKK